MDPKANRAQREKVLNTMVMAAMLGDEEAFVANMLDFFEDLDGAFTFFARRTRGAVLDLEPGRQMDRWEATVRLTERMNRDPELYADMVRHPRYVTALAVEEAAGLPILGFLAQVKEVRFVEEEPGLHWLLLPACHRGCESVDAVQAAQSPGACVMCGRPQGASGNGCKSPQELVSPLERIHAVDDHIVRSLDAGHLARHAVMKDPTQVFAQATQALFGAPPQELFGIHTTKVVADTDTLLYITRLANHAPKRAAASVAPRSEAALPRELPL